MNVHEAFDLAARLHEGQVDKGGRPYIEHCVRVMLRLPHDATDDMKIAALLHDSIEDTSMTYVGLSRLGVSACARQLILILTRGKGEPYEEYIERIGGSVQASTIKLADLADNLDPARLAQWTDHKKRDAKVAMYANALAKLIERQERRGWLR